MNIILLFLCLVFLIIAAAITIVLCLSKNSSKNSFDPATTHPGSINVNKTALLFDPSKISPAAIQ